MRFPVTLFVHQHLEWLVSLIVGILIELQGHLIVVLICISLTRDVVHLFMCLFAICVSYLVKCLFTYFDHFNWIACFHIFEFWDLHILDISPLLDRWIANIFSQSITYLFFIPLTMYFGDRNFFILGSSNLFFSCMDHAFEKSLHLNDLNLPIHGIYFHLFKCSLVSLSNALEFSVYR